MFILLRISFAFTEMSEIGKKSYVVFVYSVMSLKLVILILI